MLWSVDEKMSFETGAPPQYIIDTAAGGGESRRKCVYSSGRNNQKAY